MSEKINMDDLTDAYIALRDERDRIRTEYEAKDGALKEDMVKLEQMMLSWCNDANADSIKTKHGTVMRQLKQRFFCGDWDNFRKFILEQNAVDLLERRIHQGNFKQFMENHEGEGLPPGVNVMREYGITVRRSHSN